MVTSLYSLGMIHKLKKFKLSVVKYLLDFNIL